LERLDESDRDTLAAAIGIMRNLLREAHQQHR
jgi:hypothetical protein